MELRGPQSSERALRPTLPSRLLVGALILPVLALASVGLVRRFSVPDEPALPPKAEWYVRLYNVDDEAFAYADGEKVVSRGYYGDTGWVRVEVNDGLNTPMDHEILFRLYNGYQGYSWGYQVRLRWSQYSRDAKTWRVRDRIVYDSAAGSVSGAGANGHDLGRQNRWIHFEGLMPRTGSRRGVNSVVLRSYPLGECRWYAQIRRLEDGVFQPDFGVAREWLVRAQANGFRVGATPIAGAVLVESTGPEGHVSYVEKVNPDGGFVVSEMADGSSGAISTRTCPAGRSATVLGFIY